MRRRQIHIFIFVLIAFIVLGVGYAAINNIDLTINGTGSITATQENFLVKFLDVDGHRPAISPGSPNTVNVLGNTTATFNVSTLSKKGDTATATIDVKNESNGIGTRIGLNLTNSNDTYFKVTEHIADTELQVGDITTVTITIEMLKTPISSDEATSITATLSASPIENSSATSNNSAMVKVPSLWTLPEGRTATTLQAGDELQIKDQSFYFIRYDEDDNLVMLAKYNLNVGYNAKGEETFLQDSDVRGYKSGYKKYGNVIFSAINYWMDTSTNPYTLKSSYNDNNTIYYDSSKFKYVSDDTDAYPTIYDNAYVTAPNSSYNNTGYSIAYYIEEYKSILEGVGYEATIEDARLLLYSEANGLTGSNAVSSLTSFLRETSFYLGSASESYNRVWTVNTANSYFGSSIFDSGSAPGVRPVLVISPSNL